MKKSMVGVIWWSAILSMAASSSSISQSPNDVDKWAKTLPHKQEKLTKLHFYFHRLGGAAPSAAIVARVNMTVPSPTNFGLTVVRDDPLTVGPELSSAAIGYAQGLSVSASLDDVVLTDYFTLSFSGDGSTLAALGSNAILRDYRELPIVGGTGGFRLARGILTFQTVFFNATTREACVEVDAVVFHF